MLDISQILFYRWYGSDIAWTCNTAPLPFFQERELEGEVGILAASPYFCGRKAHPNPSQREGLSDSKLMGSTKCLIYKIKPHFPFRRKGIRGISFRYAGTTQRSSQQD
jgi:hypothetical protein